MITVSTMVVNGRRSHEDWSEVIVATERNIINTLNSKR